MLGAGAHVRPAQPSSKVWCLCHLRSCREKRAGLCEHNRSPRCTSITASYPLQQQQATTTSRPSPGSARAADHLFLRRSLQRECSYPGSATNKSPRLENWTGRAILRRYLLFPSTSSFEALYTLAVPLSSVPPSSRRSERRPWTPNRSASEFSQSLPLGREQWSPVPCYTASPEPAEVHLDHEAPPCVCIRLRRPLIGLSDAADCAQRGVRSNFWSLHTTALAARRYNHVSRQDDSVQAGGAWGRWCWENGVDYPGLYTTGLHAQYAADSSSYV